MQDRDMERYASAYRCLTDDAQKGVGAYFAVINHLVYETDADLNYRERPHDVDAFNIVKLDSGSLPEAAVEFDGLFSGLKEEVIEGDETMSLSYYKAFLATFDYDDDWNDFRYIRIGKERETYTFDDYTLKSRRDIVATFEQAHWRKGANSRWAGTLLTEHERYANLDALGQGDIFDGDGGLALKGGAPMLDVLAKTFGADAVALARVQRDPGCIRFCLLFDDIRVDDLISYDELAFFADGCAITLNLQIHDPVLFR